MELEITCAIVPSRSQKISMQIISPYRSHSPVLRIAPIASWAKPEFKRPQAALNEDWPAAGRTDRRTNKRTNERTDAFASLESGSEILNGRLSYQPHATCCVIGRFLPSCSGNEFSPFEFCDVLVSSIDPRLINLLSMIYQRTALFIPLFFFFLLFLLLLTFLFLLRFFLIFPFYLVWYEN